MTIEEQEDNNFDPGKYFTDETSDDKDSAAASETTELENAVVNNEQVEVKSKSEKDEPEPETKESTEKTDTSEKPKDSEKTITGEQKKEEVTDKDIQDVLDSTIDEEQETDTESVFDKLIPEPEPVKTSEEQEGAKTDSKFVPLDKVIKLRKRAQEAEHERDALLKAEQERKSKIDSEVSPLKKFVQENPDEDIVPAKVQLEQHEWELARRNENSEARIKVENANQAVTEAQREVVNSYKALKENAEKKEREFSKSHPDYSTVTKQVLKLSPLTPAEQKAVFSSENPAEAIYKICKSKAEAMKSLLNIPGENTNKDTSENKSTETKPKDKKKTSKDKTGNSDEQLSDEQIEEVITDDESFEGFMAGAGEDK